jgi:hypothetical protein
MDLFYVYGALFIFTIFGIFYQSSSPTSLDANFFVLSLIFFEILAVWCHGSMKYSGCGRFFYSRYYKRIMFAADGFSAISLVFAVAVIGSTSGYSNPLVDANLPICIYCLSNLLHMWAYYKQMEPIRDKWVDEMSVPLAEMAAVGTAVGEDSEDEEENVVVRDFTIGDA